jgi:hypothetical protein
LVVLGSIAGNPVVCDQPCGARHSGGISAILILTMPDRKAREQFSASELALGISNSHDPDNVSQRRYPE